MVLGIVLSGVRQDAALFVTTRLVGAAAQQTAVILQTLTTHLAHTAAITRVGLIRTWGLRQLRDRPVIGLGRNTGHAYPSVRLSRMGKLENKKTPKNQNRRVNVMSGR